ncbi:MAG: hypothetical protein WCA95_09835 [Opitutaceae bacterium]
MRVSALQPAVPVGTYPKDVFGTFIYDGILVSGRTQFSDEAVPKEIFSLLVEALEDGEEGFWWLSIEDSTNLQIYKSMSNFSPDVLIEFLGQGSLRIELDFKTHRAVFRGGDKWGAYALDDRASAAIQDLLEQQLMLGKGQLCSFSDPIPFHLP